MVAKKAKATPAAAMNAGGGSAGEAADPDDDAARSFWSGTITFGLVSIPVDLYPANRTQGVSLRMVSADGTPLARQYVCPKEERALDWDEIVRGYEIEKDEYIVVTDDELERLEPGKTRDIDLRRFVDAAGLDPIHFERAYYLTPGGNSTKAYRLLAATMEKTNRAGIAAFVMRGREYLVAILAEKGILRAETLRFADEIRGWEDVGLPAPVRANATAVKKFEKSIRGLVRRTLDEEDLLDHSAARLLKLVAAKRRSGEGVVEAATRGDAEPAEGVIDLMDVLRRSLQGQKRRRAKRAAGSDVSGKSKDELYERAKQLDIPGRSGMTKQQLVRAIERTA
ncbi:MAG: Ku protein [Gemmatimonadota bacterium]